VQVIAYIISNRTALHDSQLALSKIDLPKTEELVAKITGALKEIGFFKLTDDKDMKIFLRDIFSRAAITDREKDRLVDLFKKIEGLAKSGVARSELPRYKAE
jgi:tRNA C32,U32 (ribose-2'-O)-methylase TrmJ